MSREKNFNTKYSPEFKIAVIMDMRENHLSYRETARKFIAENIRDKSLGIDGSLTEVLQSLAKEIR